MPTIWQMLRHRTHTGSNEQGLYTCTAAASIFVCFVFSWRCTTRPWTAMKVMLVVQSWKCVTGGRLRFPAWNLQSPHRVQDRGPAQEQQRRGEGERPLETHRPEHAALDRYGFTQRCVSLLCSRPVTRTELKTACLPIHLRETSILLVKKPVVHFSAKEGADLMGIAILWRQC